LAHATSTLFVVGEKQSVRQAVAAMNAAKLPPKFLEKAAGKQYALREHRH